MHGFPYRVSEEEHQKLTPLVMDRLKISTKNILWGNCTPIPDNFPQGNKNSINGPNTIEQLVNNTSVINRNKSIKLVTENNNIELIDLYELIKPMQARVQPVNDNIHLTDEGEIIIGKCIVNHLIKYINKMKKA